MKVDSKLPPLDSSIVQKNSKADTRDPKVMEAAKMFESQFLRQMVSEMRKTVPENEFLPAGMGEKIFREQLDNEYADNWTGQGGIGLADMIYEQLMQRQELQNLPKDQRVRKTEFYPLDKKVGPTFSGSAAEKTPEKVGPTSVDLISKKSADLFVAKKTSEGFHIKSKDSLQSNVALHSPLPGLILQAAALEDGRQQIYIRHDKGLVSQIVHTGQNYVKAGDQVIAGQPLGYLPAEQTSGINPAHEKRVAEVFFGLRRSAKPE